MFLHFVHRSGKGKKVILICTGTLTNAALLLKVYPSIVDKIEIVFMGGSIGAGCLAGTYKLQSGKFVLATPTATSDADGTSLSNQFNVHDNVICSGANGIHINHWLKNVFYLLANL